MGVQIKSNSLEHMEINVLYSQQFPLATGAGLVHSSSICETNEGFICQWRSGGAERSGLGLWIMGTLEHFRTYGR